MITIINRVRIDDYVYKVEHLYHSICVGNNYLYTACLRYENSIARYLIKPDYKEQFAHVSIHQIYLRTHPKFTHQNKCYFK